MLGTLTSGAPQRKYLQTKIRIWMIVLMALTSMMALIDRYLLSILLVPIQQDIQVSDTAMGFLSGFAFIIIYSIAGVPLGRYADRGHRRNMLAIAVAIWSVASMLCGTAANYIQLLLARIGVAAGESAAGPANMSMIGDIIEERWRATAIAAIFVGSSLGVVIGSFAAGALNDLYGWRTAFVIIGAPGLLLAILIWLTFPEPVRGAYEAGNHGSVMDEDSKSIRRTLRYVLSVQTFPALIVGKAMMQIAFQAWLLWLPTFLIRVHNMTPAEMGLWFGLSSGGGAIVSSIIGGPAGDYLATLGKRWYLYFCGGATALGIPLVLVALNAESLTITLIAMFFYTMVVGTAASPSVAAGLTIVRPRMRGFVTVVTYICVNMIGAGVGPLIVGATSDWLNPIYGDQAIRYSLLIVPATLVLSSIGYFWGSLSIEQDARRAAIFGDEIPAGE
jgi:predicted MFS family arabinose efflux permease